MLKLIGKLLLQISGHPAQVKPVCLNNFLLNVNLFTMFSSSVIKLCLRLHLLTYRIEILWFLH